MGGSPNYCPYRHNAARLLLVLLGPVPKEEKVRRNRKFDRRHCTKNLSPSPTVIANQRVEGVISCKGGTPPSYAIETPSWGSWCNLIPVPETPEGAKRVHSAVPDRLLRLRIHSLVLTSTPVNPRKSTRSDQELDSKKNLDYRLWTLFVHHIRLLGKIVYFWLTGDM